MPRCGTCSTATPADCIAMMRSGQCPQEIASAGQVDDMRRCIQCGHRLEPISGTSVVELRQCPECGYWESRRI